MKKSHLCGAVCSAALVILSNSAHAALVSQLLGLDIDGTLYDVTFHTGAGDTFQALWDADNDGVFGGGASVFTAAPTFWGDQVGAETARDAIMGVLGAVDTTTTSPSDNFLVPFKAQGSPGDTISTAVDNIANSHDTDNRPNVDDLRNGTVFEDDSISATHPYASFTVSAVPIPAAVWLFGSGLLGLVGMARRKKAV